MYTQLMSSHCLRFLVSVSRCPTVGFQKILIHHLLVLVMCNFPQANDFEQ